MKDYLLARSDGHVMVSVSTGTKEQLERVYPKGCPFQNYSMFDLLMSWIKMYSWQIRSSVPMSLIDFVKEIRVDGKSVYKEEIIKYCLTLENTYKDCPFSDDFESVTMKHCKNKKWFALLMNVNNKLYLNVKTDPNYSDILRNAYDYIIPAYHMNKEHWNTIIIDEKVDEDLVKELIEQSYQLTK